MPITRRRGRQPTTPVKASAPAIEVTRERAGNAVLAMNYHKTVEPQKMLDIFERLAANTPLKDALKINNITSGVFWYNVKQIPAYKQAFTEVKEFTANALFHDYKMLYDRVLLQDDDDEQITPQQASTALKIVEYAASFLSKEFARTSKEDTQLNASTVNIINITEDAISRSKELREKVISEQ